MKQRDPVGMVAVMDHEICWCELTQEQFDERAAHATPNELASAYLHLSVTAQEQGNFEIAHAHAHSALDASTDHAMSMLIWSNIAYLYQIGGEAVRACDAASRALVFATLANDQSLVAMAEENMGGAYMMIAPDFAAEHHAFAAAAASTPDVDDHEQVTRNMCFAAYGNRLAGRDPEALIYAEAAFQFSESHHVDPRELIFAHEVAADVLADQGDQIAAGGHRQAAEVLAAQFGMVAVRAPLSVWARIKLGFRALRDALGD